MDRRNQNFSNSNSALQKTVAELQAELDKTRYTLRERVKELSCHNQIAKILSKNGIYVEDAVRQIVEMIPQSWQFPEIAQAQISLKGELFSSRNYRHSNITLCAPLFDGILPIGEVLVSYPEECLPASEPIFLPEETDLINGIAGSLSNFIQKKIGEDTLFQSVLRYRNLVENIDDIIYEVDEKGTIIYISPGIDRKFGYRADEMVGQNFLKFFHPESQSILLQRFRDFFHISTGANDYLLLKKDGTTSWVRLSTKVKIIDGQFKGGVGIMVDVDETVRVHEELKKSEALYRSFINASPDTVIITDLDGQILFISPKSQKVFGLKDITPIPGKTILEFICGDDQERVLKNIHLMMDGKGFGAETYKGKRGDGTLFEMDMNGDLVRDENGNPEKLIFIVRDITDRKAVEQKLKSNQQILNLFVENAPAAIAMFDNEMKYIAVSNRFLHDVCCELREQRNCNKDGSRPSGWDF